MNPKQKVGIGCLLMVTVAALVLGFGAYKLGSDADADLRKEIALAKADGLWLQDFSELVPAVPSGQNAAPTYQAAFEIEERTKLPDKLLDANNPESRQTFEKYLDSMKVALNLAEKASRMPAAVFNHDYSNVATISWSEFSSMKGLVRALSIKAELEASAHRGSQAMADLATAARISAQSGHVQMLIGILVEISCDSIVLSTLERVLTLVPQSAPAAKEVLASLGPVPVLSLAVRAEYLGAFQALSKPFGTADMGFGENTPPAFARMAWLSRFQWARNRWQVGLTRYYRSLYESVSRGQSPKTMLDATTVLDQGLSGSKRFDEEGLVVFSPGFSSSVSSVVRDIAWRRLEAQAVTILTSAKFPSQLPLSGEMAIDPRNEKPLHYKLKHGGFQIYAVGNTGIDHGGIRPGGDRSMVLTDLVFDYPYKKPEIPHVVARSSVPFSHVRSSSHYNGARGD